MGLFLIILSVPFYFVFHPVGIIISFVGFVIICFKKQKQITTKIKKERAKKIYHQIRYNFPVSEETISLSKLNDISPNIESHKIWLSDATDALEKEFRISNRKMFQYNRNRSAAVVPYIIIDVKNKNYKKDEEYEKVFLKHGNYNKICKFLNRSVNSFLEKELDLFTKLVEKQESKSK